MFFGKDQPESEGSRYAHPGIKSLPDQTPGAAPGAGCEFGIAMLDPHPEKFI